ncbi:Succinate dehydrogenase assembly factor 2, mitochondrial [Orobanche gracilis]
MEMADLSRATTRASEGKSLVFLSVREKVINNLDNHAAPETRATLGQSWVRGWDDFKKGRDSPTVGNQ